MQKAIKEKIRLFLKLLGQFAIVLGVLFISAGTLRWQMGWLVMGLYFLVLVGSFIFIRMESDFIEERIRVNERTKGWDKVLAGFLRILSPLGLIIVAGLDHRFKWSPIMPLLAQYLALLMSSIGYGISIWAVSTNEFYYGFVRIEGDRGHTVVQSGPYRYIRHPGYAGSILVQLSLPIALGSIWALVVGMVASMLVFIRTRLEDRSLIEELPGYREYAEGVRSRVIPGVW